jgi:ammonium transporter, Amt family
MLGSAKTISRLSLLLSLMTIGLIAFAFPAWGQEVLNPASPEQAAALLLTPKVMLDTIWVLFAASLVFFMNLGFAMLESGLCRAKNCVNILAKNFVVFCVSSLTFLFVGWGLMFGDGNGFMGTQGLFFLRGADNSPASWETYNGVYKAISWAGIPLFAKFFFQLVFAGTAATIVSGVVAERIRFAAFVTFSFAIISVMYPITGHWVWGDGWLAAYGFYDFAGSTVVHSVGGWAALAGVLVLGPRQGKFDSGKVHPIPGHNMTTATIGAFVLWFGWFGFNPGSTLAADPRAISHIAVVTNIAAAAASLSALVMATYLTGKPDFSMILNGALAGLVASTASCASVGIESALLIGLVAGALVVWSVLFFDRLQIDDPVGALSVHLVNGIWGTLAVGLFSDPSVAPVAGPLPGLFFGGGLSQLGVQVMGVVMVGLYTFGVAFFVWTIINMTMGVRVSEQEEREGLDLGEHGNMAYPDFRPESLVSLSVSSVPTGGPAPLAPTPAVMNPSPRKT